MKKNLLTLSLISTLIISMISCKQKPTPLTDYTKESKDSYEARMKWWNDARFGMFIHWGVYSVPAGIYNGNEVKGGGEWIMNRAKIPIPEYEKFGKEFNPVKFDAAEWVRIAKDAGMKYIVITSKHHDGFGLWNSKVSKYDIVDFSPYRKDVLKMLSDECAKQGITLCFYHSIMDWHHPDANAENWAKYRENYLKPQLKELLTGYGKPGVLWFDGEWIKEWTEDQGKDIYNYLRNIQPDLIINNRVGKGRKGMQGMNKDTSFVGDFGTPEQEILSTSSSMAWESCMTMNNTWGFKTNDTNWKSSENLIKNLVDIVSKGGNFLLNVGPTSEGLIPAASVERLKEMGKWIKVNGEAIYGVRQLKSYKEGDDLRFTISADGKLINAFIMNWPGKQLNIKQIKPNDGSKIRMTGYDIDLKWNYDVEKGLTIELPDQANLPCKFVWVLKIEGAEI
ncbi:MAG: alpha-L-fucosidase [Bacteroidia bacterium]|nr:alpha-L-fucosidase [Bacteroidia bacterium]